MIIIIIIIIMIIIIIIVVIMIIVIVVLIEIQTVIVIIVMIASESCSEAPLRPGAGACQPQRWPYRCRINKHSSRCRQCFESSDPAPPISNFMQRYPQQLTKVSVYLSDRCTHMCHVREH